MGKLSNFPWLSILQIYLMLNIIYTLFSGVIGSQMHWGALNGNPEMSFLAIRYLEVSPTLDIIFPFGQIVMAMFPYERLNMFIGRSWSEDSFLILSESLQNILFGWLPFYIKTFSYINTVVILCFLYLFLFLYQKGLFFKHNFSKTFKLILKVFFGYLSLSFLIFAMYDFGQYYLLDKFVPDQYHILPFTMNIISVVFPYSIIICWVLYKLVIEFVDKYINLMEEVNLTI